MILQDLKNRNLIHPPDWLISNCQYLTAMGSVAYGTETDSSDKDFYGWTIPSKQLVFPYLDGEIPGFGKQKNRFEQYQQHHIKYNHIDYDVTIYNIVKYFDLLMANNPNILDSIFVPQNCIVHITRIGQIVRENRKIFLHKGCWFKLKGYAFSQLHKAKGKNPQGKRIEIREKYGWDVKFGMHVVRLLGQCEQILVEGDLNLQRNKEHLKAIRRGEVSLEDVGKWFTEKERQLEKLYVESKLQHSPDQEKIKTLLLQCLEEHWGSIDNCIQEGDEAIKLIQEMDEVLQRYHRRIKS